jgi:hypothetical protein
MNRKNIAVISLDVDDFQSYIKWNIDDGGSSSRKDGGSSSRKKHVTEFATYYCISKPEDTCSLTIDTVLFTDKAIFNKELTKIIEIMKPCIFPQHKKTITDEEFLKAKEIVWQYAKQEDSFDSNGKVPWGGKYLRALLPREDRELNKAVAKHFGYFWLPCEICGEEFAGFEWFDDHTIREKNGIGTGVCYKPECGSEAKKRSVIRIDPWNR